MRRSGRVIAFAAAGALAAFAARDAAAFCRTLTCQPSSDFSPSEAGQCTPDDLAAECAALNPPEKVLPLWWRNACVSYDLQEDASIQVPYATASQVSAEAFSKWTSTLCPFGGASAPVSISAHDLGPVSCDLVQYSSDQGNQHVIAFRDDGWPHADNSMNTLGLTTVTYDSNSGEIYDADIEINSGPGVTLSVGDPVPADAYDFASIITHEAGHFLGLAHAVDPETTMYAFYDVGTSTKRILSDDDMAGICAIYPPDGTRSVDPSVSASGSIQADACDPTPRHGFQSECAQPQKMSCAAAGGGSSSPLTLLFAFASSLAGAGAYRRGRGRRPARDAT